MGGTPTSGLWPPSSVTIVRNRVEAEPKGGRRITTFAAGVPAVAPFFLRSVVSSPRVLATLYNPALEL